MLKVKTFEDAKALIGQTLGSGKDQRVITRIEQLRISSWTPNVLGHVYWKRPGGEERSIGKSLQNYLAWARKAPRQTVHSLRQVEAFLGTVPDDSKIEGFVSRVDNQVTISFKVVSNA